jgi:hypothetical protein
MARKRHKPEEIVAKLRQVDVLGRLALALLLAVTQATRAARKQARHVVENLLLPSINLVRMNPVPLGQLRHCRVLAQRLQRDLRLTWGRSGQVRYHQGDIG